MKKLLTFHRIGWDNPTGDKKARRCKSTAVSLKPEKFTSIDEMSDGHTRIGYILPGSKSVDVWESHDKVLKEFNDAV